MSVKYRKVVNNRKNSKTEGKVYGRAVVDGVIDTKEIAGKISKRCTLTEPDIIAVINALQTEIGYGKRVVLEGFGSFKVGVTTTPADSAKKFTSANIKGMHVIFLPATEMEQGKRVKNMLRNVKAEEMTEYTRLDNSNVTDPGNTDPGSTDPGKTDPGNTDSGNTDSGKTDSGDVGL